MRGPAGIEPAWPRQKRETAASLMQGQPKRNTPIVQAEAQHRPQDKPKERLRRSRTPAIRARSRLAGNAGLFDRHGEPPDQPRDFVQMVGIVLRDGLCKPNQALVIAHLGGVWNGRRRWPHREGPDVWHRITSWRIPARHQVCGANTSFWGSVRSAAVVRDRPARRQIAFFVSSKTATSPCRAGSLHRPLRLRASGLFPALQGSGALLYAARRDPWGFACSSVAQR